MFETDEKIKEINTVINEKLDTYFTDTFSPGETKQQLRVGNEVVSDYVNPIFGTGEDGDLYIKAGETKTIASGVYNYNNLTIESTGILAPADGDNPFIIKVKGTTKILGTIAFNGIDGSYRAGGEISNQFGEVLTKGTTGQGGNGGNGNGASSSGGLGGSGGEGIGGGGGGGKCSTFFVGINYGGNGGNGGSDDAEGGYGVGHKTPQTNLNENLRGRDGYFGGGGSGGFISENNGSFDYALSGVGGGRDNLHSTGQAGGNGLIINQTSGTVIVASGGGCGGGRGYNGADLILIANNLSGTGTINTSGSNGYNGGNGGTNTSAYGSGGGGGGGGGASGIIAIVYEGENNLTTINNVGTGGTRGYAEIATNIGNNGVNGSSGTQGVKIIKKLSEIY